MPFYAVRKGVRPGIYTNYSEVQEQVSGFSNAEFRKFNDKTSAFEYLMVKTLPENDQTQSSRTNKDVNTAINTDSIKRKQLQPTSSSSSAISREDSNDFTFVEVKKAKLADSSTKPTTAKLPTLIPLGSSSKVIPTTSRNTIDKTQSPIKSVKSPTREKSPPKNLKFSPSKFPSTGSKTTSYLTEYEERKNESFSFNGKSVVAYTDGACSNNGYPNAKAGIGVFWGRDHPLNISKKLIGHPTNIRAELTAATVAISQAINYNASEITLYTDSQFVIDCIQKYIKTWKRNNWTLANGKPVKNVEEIKRLDELCSKIKITWKYIEAHKGHDGNTEADLLATGAIKY